MTTSPNGRKMIESFEGLRLTSYQDTGGVWTIGYGHTADVWPDQTITQQEADDFFAIDLHQMEKVVYTYVHVDLGQNQFDAVVSLAYNLRLNDFRTSTVVRLLNAGDFEGAAAAWIAPKTIFNKVDGKYSQGLNNRRMAEHQLFITPEGS